MLAALLTFALVACFSDPLSSHRTVVALLISQQKFHVVIIDSFC